MTDKEDLIRIFTNAGYELYIEDNSIQLSSEAGSLGNFFNDKEELECFCTCITTMLRPDSKQKKEN